MSRPPTLDSVLAERKARAWDRLARPEQRLPAGDWFLWLIMGGRGGGKTRSAAEAVRSFVERGIYGRIALIAPDPEQAREVMLEGTSGLTKIAWRPHQRPVYKANLKRVEFHNGAMAKVCSSVTPEDMEGPEYDLVWGDEMRNWKYPRETWDAMLLGLRWGPRPRGIFTTTPTRLAIIKALIADAERMKGDPEPKVRLTRVSTHDNRANLPPSFFEEVIKRYKGTSLERTMIDGLPQDEVEGALWSWEILDRNRVPEAPEMTRVIVAIDPAVTSKEDSNETGIIVAGKGRDGRAYVLSDLSGILKPDAWARRAVGAHKTFEGDRIIGEANNGGDLVEVNVRTVDPNVPYRAVHASRGKLTRAEPVSALYEQDRVRHVGAFPELEEQLTTWVPGDKSPDRLDALVWAVTELLLAGGGGPGIA